MKDIVITSRRLLKELYVILGCFAVSSIINVIAVVAFSRPWIEIFSQIGYVIVITVVIYAVLLLLRLLWLAIVKLIIKR